MTAPPSSNAGNAGCLIPMGALFSLAGIVFGLAALLGAKGCESPSQKMMGAGVLCRSPHWNGFDRRGQVRGRRRQREAEWFEKKDLAI